VTRIVLKVMERSTIPTATMTIGTARPVCSDGSCGVKQDLISSFPDRVQLGKWRIVPAVPINEFARAKIDAQSMN